MLYKGTLQIVPNPINIYKYATGTLNKGQPLKRVERGKGLGRMLQRVGEVGEGNEKW